MDSALKQRLLGAAVLIALAIIFVPMMLSNAPQKQDTTTQNLAIPPPPDRKFETRTLAVEAPSAPATASVPPDANKVATVDTHAPPRVDAHPEESAAVTAPAKPEAKPAPAETKPAAAEAKPLAAETKPAPTPANPNPPPSGRFAVSLGVYADQAHADALVAKVKGLGQPAYAEATQYQGKAAMRVRVGPFADRAAAESARLKIKQAEPKVPSSVVEASEAVPPDAPPALPANRAGGFAVQVGAFKSEAEANKLRDRLRGGGVAAFVDRTGAGAGMLWRVRAGPYAERAGADSARATLKQKFQLDGNVVTQP